jgi:hypothetical protein
MDNPKLFISYCWTNSAHENWVIDLAKELVENGIDVILDKWDLKEGNDAVVFMEKMVSDPNIKKVLIISDRQYVIKANERKGGVGTESQIISSEVYEKTDQNKFVVAITEYEENGKPCLPVYYKSRIYIDLSNDELYSKNFDQLLRWVYDKPLHIKPELGQAPSFLNDTTSINLGTTSAHRRAIDNIKNGKESTKGALLDYFNTVIENFEKFRILNITVEYDDALIENIDLFIPYRNELIDIFTNISIYQNHQEIIHLVHNFFEKLIPYMDRPENITSHYDYGYDNFKFIIHELFLYCFATLLKNECFESASYLINTKYYVERNSDYGRNVLVSFNIFRNYLQSLDRRNKRQNLRRLSLHADLLKNRNTGARTHFNQIMQADFILYIVDCLDSLRYNEQYRWYPITLIYKGDFHGALELFARAQSKMYFDKIKIIFGINDHTEFVQLLNAYKEGKLKTPQWEHVFINPSTLLNYEKLCSAK